MEKNLFVFLLCSCVVFAGYAVPGTAEAPAAREETEAENTAVEPVRVQLVPGVSITGFDRRATNHLLFGALGGIGHNLSGFGLSGIGLSNTGFVRGVQLSGLYNTVSRDMTGLETAGIFNWARKDIRGAQVAGIFNVAGGSGTGLQMAGALNWTNGSFNGLQMGVVNYSGGDDGSGARIGIVNISESGNVVPVGVVNIVKDGLMRPAIWHDDLGVTNLSLKSGSKYFYSILSLGVHEDLLRDNNHIFVIRAGLGAELPLNKVFLNADIITGQITSNYPWEKMGGTAFIVQARFSAGYQFFKHLGIFAGLSYDYVLSPNDDSPRPGKDFGVSALGRSDGRRSHKIGFFGGIQL